MITRIEVASLIPDTRAQVRKKRLLSSGFSQVNSVWITDVYTIDKKLLSKQLQYVASALANPVMQKATINQSQSPEKFNVAIEIGFLPGVTDNIATTTKELIEDVLKVKFALNENVFTSQVIFVSGKLSMVETQEIAHSFFNTVIQQVHIKSFSRFKKRQGNGYYHSTC